MNEKQIVAKIAAAFKNDLKFASWRIETDIAPGMPDMIIRYGAEWGLVETKGYTASVLDSQKAFWLKAAPASITIVQSVADTRSRLRVYSSLDYSSVGATSSMLFDCSNERGLDLLKQNLLTAMGVTRE